MKSYQRLQERRAAMTGQIVVGIDPAKDKHQALTLDAAGLPLGQPFTFPVTREGYADALWRKLRQQAGDLPVKGTVFAIENSCNLWQTLAQYLHAAGWTVVLASPLATKNSRATATNDFSKTDPKDALLIASNARQGYFSDYRRYDDAAETRHRLSITYDKLRRDYVRQRNRLRAALDLYFPEFPQLVSLETKAAAHLLQTWQLPADFLQLDIETAAAALEKVSAGHYGRDALLALREAAKTSIGLPCGPIEAAAIRAEIRGWLQQIQRVEADLETVFEQLRPLAAQLPQFEILTGLKGISDKLAALYLAELRDPAQFTHYGQIEKAAGYNLVLCDSGRSHGVRRISPIGNRRLRWILYRMAEETVRYIPEVRLKYLRRQIKKSCYRQNVVAAIPTLLKLITALCQRNQAYEYRPETQALLKNMEAEYERVKAKRKGRPRP